MTLSTCDTLVAIANEGEVAAYWGRGIDTNVRIAAVILGASSTLEMHASRNTIRGRVMGEVACFLTSITLAMTQIVFADGELVDVV